MKLTKHYANEGRFKQLFILILLMFLAPAVAVNAQRIFDIENPAGTYIITDYLNRKITLKIGKVEGRDAIFIKGRGSATANGRTLIGNWDMSEWDGKYYLAFHTYDNVNMKYSLPSGTIKCDQIIVSDDGRVSYNISELLKNNSDYIKARRATATKSGAKKSKKRK